jgi:hypothetical protein
MDERKQTVVGGARCELLLHAHAFMLTSLNELLVVCLGGLTQSWRSLRMLVLRTLTLRLAAVVDVRRAPRLHLRDGRFQKLLPVAEETGAQPSVCPTHPLFTRLWVHESPSSCGGCRELVVFFLFEPSLLCKFVTLGLYAGFEIRHSKKSGTKISVPLRGVAELVCRQFKSGQHSSALTSVARTWRECGTNLSVCSHDSRDAQSAP